MAPSSSSGLTFKLHPLVMLNISDHFTRVKTQLNPPSSSCAPGNIPAAVGATFPQNFRVYGCVIGAQRGRTVEIFNSFELVFDPTTDSLDGAFLEKKQELYQKVFPGFYVLGWYSTGSEANESDMHIHKALMDINESPVYVLLNPAINHAQKDLPVTIYESEFHVIDGIPQSIFVDASYTIETVEAERISVDHVAHLKPSDGGSAATQCKPFILIIIFLHIPVELMLIPRCCAVAAHLTGIHSAIKMLNSRIRVLFQYLVAMQKGDIPCDDSLLRQAASLLRSLPAAHSEKFNDNFLMEYNDKLLMSYLAIITNCTSNMNEVVDKVKTAYAKKSRTGGSRIPFM
ncbi:unnamed protein product [Brassica napus]|uniref:COP9 signalosome complex subunit 6 n=1 Tax=Brassica napus TaxID=3708 RepID=A0A816N9C0_BRANA|nr:unnamed protein product [Brassica napus]